MDLLLEAQVALHELLILFRAHQISEVVVVRGEEVVEGPFVGFGGEGEIMEYLSLVKLPISNELIMGHFQHKLFLELVSALEQIVLMVLAPKSTREDEQQQASLDLDDLLLHVLGELVVLVGEVQLVEDGHSLLLVYA